MKKKIIVSIASHLLVVAMTSAQTFVHNFNEAQTQAKEESKTLLMIFSGSDWCKPCIQLKKTILKDPTFAKYAAGNLVLLELDFPYKKKNRLPKEQRVHNEKMADRYNPKGIFPMMLLMNDQGEVVQQLSFDPALSPKDYINQLNRSISKS